MPLDIDFLAACTTVFLHFIQLLSSVVHVTNTRGNHDFWLEVWGSESAPPAESDTKMLFSQYAPAQKMPIAE